MRIVVDTSILIRMLISPDGVVAGLFYPLGKQHELFVCYNSFEEINKHRARLLKLSGLNKVQFDELLASFMSFVTIVPLDHIPDSFYIKSVFFTAGTDYEDVPFVATALFIGGYLWTSDKDLFYGLKKKGFAEVLNNASVKKLIKSE